MIKESNVVGIGGTSTGKGVFTLANIEPNTWITSYAPLAPLHPSSQHHTGDYIIKTHANGRAVDLDGALCPLGIGKIVQDGSFPFCLVNKFSAMVKCRLNCVFGDRDGEIWLKSTRKVHVGEELLTRYSHDNSYWKDIFDVRQISIIKNCLSSLPGNSISEAENAIKQLSLS